MNIVIIIKLFVTVIIVQVLNNAIIVINVFS